MQAMHLTNLAVHEVWQSNFKPFLPSNSRSNNQRCFVVFNQEMLSCLALGFKPKLHRCSTFISHAYMAGIMEMELLAS